MCTKCTQKKMEGKSSQYNRNTRPLIHMLSECLLSARGEQDREGACTQSLVYSEGDFSRSYCEQRSQCLIEVCLDSWALGVR